MRLLVEGEPIEVIDNALVKFGFPVGPIQLLDEVGIDTGTKIIPVLESAFGERFSHHTALRHLLRGKPRLRAADAEQRIDCRVGPFFAFTPFCLIKIETTIIFC